MDSRPDQLRNADGQPNDQERDWHPAVEHRSRNRSTDHEDEDTAGEDGSGVFSIEEPVPFHGGDARTLLMSKAHPITFRDLGSYRRQSGCQRSSG